VPDPCTDNLGYFFSDTAQRVPGRVAVVDLWGAQRREFSFAELDRRANGVAAFFQAQGAMPGERIALLVGNRCEYIESFFGLMRAGLVSVPLNPKQAEANLEFMLRDSGASGVILDIEACPLGAVVADRLGLRYRVILPAQTPPANWESLLANWQLYEAVFEHRAPVFTPRLSPDGIAFQPYTAGSTGKPKGVRLRHEGMLWSIRSTEAKWPTSPDEVGLVCVPLFHKNAMRGTVKPNLFAGARTVLMPRYEPKEFLQTLASERATYCGGVPAIFSMILQHQELISRLDFSALKLLVIGSAVVPTELVRNLNRIFPNAKVKESYGLTEGGGPLRGPVDGRITPPGSAGIIAEGYEVKLVAVDGTHGAEEGELWTRSPCVTDGYHNLPELTRERIVDGWLRTGDLFRVDREGFYYFRGRVDDMFSCGGENIYPREVESLLLGHPDVTDACVVPVAHSVKGLVPAAMVVLRPGALTDGEALKAYSLANGPAYAHPRRVLVVDSIPLGSAGKPDKGSIREALKLTEPGAQ
jgi:long-chain acyl-CoA synthetase